MAQACLNYGQRVQFSLFECTVGEAELVRLRHDLLREYVQAILRHAQRLDAPRRHLARQHRLFEQVAGGLGDQPALAGAADQVAGPADALQPAGDVARRRDLDPAG